VIPPVIVGDLGQGGELGGHPVEIRLGYRHGGQGEAAAQALGVEEGTKAAEQAPLASNPWIRRISCSSSVPTVWATCREGTLDEGKAALIAVDEGPFQVAQHGGRGDLARSTECSCRGLAGPDLKGTWAGALGSISQAGFKDGDGQRPSSPLAGA
jgi:hypothetical protein